MHNLKQILFLFGLVVIGFPNTEINAQETTTIPDRKPIIVLQEITRAPHEGKDKIIWTLGFLNPNFVLYDDGLVIFKNDKDQFELFSVELTPQEINTLSASLSRIGPMTLTFFIFRSCQYLIKYRG